MKIVDVMEVTKKFKDTVALDKISLSMIEGEIYGLLGPNGAGKTTLINVLCGLLVMDKGNVQMFDKDMVKERTFIKKNMGVVPQELAIYEDLTAAENVKFFAGLYGLRGKELKDRVTEALEFVGLLEHAQKCPKEFSGGMKRRLNIACAIAHKPRLLIMDEPTVGIDPQSRNYILNSVKKLNHIGCTVIYTTHYMEEAEELCSRIGIIDHGKLIAEGTKEELESIVTDSSVMEISLNNMSMVKVEEIEKIKGVTSVSVSDNCMTINSSKDVNNLDQIIGYFTERKSNIVNIQSKIPTLESVFLTLTGRKLRD